MRQGQEAVEAGVDDSFDHKRPAVRGTDTQDNGGLKGGVDDALDHTVLRSGRPPKRRSVR